MVLPLLGNTWSHEGLLLYMDNQVDFIRDIAKVTNDSAVVLQSIGVAMADTVEQVSQAASTVNTYKVRGQAFAGARARSRFRVVHCVVYVCVGYRLRLRNGDGDRLLLRLWRPGELLPRPPRTHDVQDQLPHLRPVRRTHRTHSTQHTHTHTHSANN